MPDNFQTDKLFFSSTQRNNKKSNPNKKQYEGT
jgi:hypothetical protein